MKHIIEKILDINEILLDNIISYLICALILVIGFVLKKPLANLISNLIFRLFRRFINLDEVKQFKSFLSQPIQLFVLAFVIYIALHQIKHFPFNKVIFSHGNKSSKFQKEIEKANSDNKPQLITIETGLTYGEFINRLFSIAITVSIFWAISRISKFFSQILLNKATREGKNNIVQLLSFSFELAQIIITIICVLVVLTIAFNLNIGLIVGGLGAGTLGLGLAAKSSLENLLSAFTIFSDKPFILGDNIKVKNVEGVVEKIGFRSTKIRTLEKTLSVIPNSILVNEIIDNRTARTFRREKFLLGLIYSTTQEQLNKIIDDINNYFKNDSELDNDNSVAAFDSFGDSSLNILVLYYIKRVTYPEFVKIKQDVHYKIIGIVKANNSDFAFPTRTIISS
ncbi:MAG: mechanosensitive ion channel family protein [Solitalea-like symbiont of Tyrophagus putrescentiae]